MPNNHDEAIALAKTIERNPHLWPHDSQKVLARALLAATAPGAQYRAGMEAVRKIVDDSCNRFKAPGCTDTMTGREAWELGATDAALFLAADIRAAIAALPASPEPAPDLVPMAMPEPKWEGDSLKFCGLVVGSIDHASGEENDEEPWVGWAAIDGGEDGDAFTKATAPDARLAVEAAVRERLGGLPPKDAVI